MPTDAGQDKKIQNKPHTELNISKTIALIVDASKTGAYILQKHKEIQNPEYYASRMLNKAKENYSVIELESLAIVWVIKFSKDLLGKKFTILSDHKSLLSGNSKLISNSRIAIWLLSLANYEFEIQNIKGSRNVIPDKLSRIARPECEQKLIYCNH